ncbi:MAG: M23 family metallopeptidase [Muribaculaceae bacterium]|nr:M23 family metallopeptidase [Muribaculaceae bacterium]MBR5171372.1 M23 family metallopeptidase [Muribaculaceae bacterium]
MKLSFNSLRLSFIGIALISVSIAASAQSISDYRKAHRDLLAKQEKIKDKIKVEEAQKYAQDLYGDKQVDNADIYSEAWNSDRVNPYQNASIPTSKVLDVSKYAMPVKNNAITSHFGYRKQFGRMHYGVDLKASVGDTVYAAFSGKVRLTKFERNGYGFFVIVRHDNGMETVYGHLSKFLVKPNQYVKAGTPIALSGNTGRSTGPHLHFETRYMGVAMNPEKIFDFINGTTYHDTFTFNKNENNNSGNNRQSASRRRR